MRPVLVIAAQPTVDHTAVVPDFMVGRPYRLVDVKTLPSGKALNVARVLHGLNVPVIVVALLAGHSGAWIKEQLEAIGIQVINAWMPGENRLAYSIYDPLSGQLTELIEENDGPVTDEVWLLFLEKVKRAMQEASAVAISGKGPRGFPGDGYRTFVELSHSLNLPVFVDCYGPLLANALLSRPFLVKINRKEASELIQGELTSLQDCVKAGQKLVRNNSNILVITAGGEGAVIVTEDEVWTAEAPVLKGAAIGSGDAMMAGLIYAFLNHAPTREMLKIGVALGAANVLIPGAGLFDEKDVWRLLNEIDVRNFHG